MGFRSIRRAAYMAGSTLYEDLVHRSGDVKVRSISDRVGHLLQGGTDPSVCGLVDDYEYAFTLDGVGIEASGLAITDDSLQQDGYVYLYDPEYGIDILKVDLTTREMYALINNYKD